MSTQHTPGPWYALPQQSSNSAYYIKGSDRNGEMQTIGLGAVAIIPRSTRKPVDANARLIASAPSLFDALRDAIECFQNTGGLTDAAVDKACRALARAKGEIT